MSELTTKERKKEFERLFKNKILPFFEEHGFIRHTKTSKRIFKKFDKGLSVFIFFEYKTRFEFYDLSISYFDEDLGDVYNDQYLAIAKPKVTGRGFRGDSALALDLAVDQWLVQLKSSVIPFIEEHSSHKSILESDGFYISKPRATELIKLLKLKI